MRGGAIQLLLLKNIGGGCVVCNSVDWCDLFCKKMEIVDEMLELVNLCYCTHWHSTHIVTTVVAVSIMLLLLACIISSSLLLL